jgi:hypothetical protein
MSLHQRYRQRRLRGVPAPGATLERISWYFPSTLLGSAFLTLSALLRRPFRPLPKRHPFRSVFSDEFSFPSVDYLPPRVEKSYAMPSASLP